jgi:hypothetical protein
MFLMTHPRPFIITPLIFETLLLLPKFGLFFLFLKGVRPHRACFTRSLLASDRFLEQRLLSSWRY